MTPETPLEDVATYLPREAATVLMDTDPIVQTAVLTHLRSMLVYWERGGYDLDPVAYEGVLNALIPVVGSIYKELFSALDANHGLKLLLQEQTNLIADLADKKPESSRIAELLRTGGLSLLKPKSGEGSP